jgi:pimeloyl-ACP methyl ester carboxylesterase
VLDAAGGSSALYGSSSGAALAIHAAAALPGITRLVLWEPPYFADDSWPRPPADQVEQYNKMLAEGRRGDAAEYFMAKVVGLPPEFIADARSQPWWPAQEALAHTLPYDATIMGDYSVPVDLARRVSIPTLVVTGDASFPFMGPTARALADALPHGSVVALPGQRHDVDDAVLAPAVAEFLRTG